MPRTSLSGSKPSELAVQAAPPPQASPYGQATVGAQGGTYGSPYAPAPTLSLSAGAGAPPSNTPYPNNYNNSAPRSASPFAPRPRQGGQTPYQNPYPQNQYQNQNQAPNPTQTPYNQGPYQDPYADPYQDPYGSSPQPYPRQPQKPRTWRDRMGFSAISTFFRGALRGGGGARDTGDWEEVFVGEAELEGEVSAITSGGLEYGINVEGRAEYEEGRKGFTRRLPDCPPTLAGCASVTFNGVPVGLRGHTSQFYTTGPDVADDAQIALESAHLFLRSAYGDMTVGRDDGAAYLFSLGAPTLLNTGASNASVDYTGIDAVKTVNDVSGFSEKVTYTSPRLLGDQIGVGVQFGVSYALDPYACGVDYCVERDGVTNVLTPDLKDVVEVGIALDRTFDNGVSIEATGTYGRAAEVSQVAGFDDLESFGAGIEVRMADFTLGGSYLTSNQGVDSGDYESYDAGLTWQPSALGFTLGYGHATDDLVGLTSDQFVAGISWDINDRMRISTGVQYADRKTLRDTGGLTAQEVSDDSLGVFIEGGINF